MEVQWIHPLAKTPNYLQKISLFADFLIERKKEYVV